MYTEKYIQKALKIITHLFDVPKCATIRLWRKSVDIVKKFTLLIGIIQFSRRIEVNSVEENVNQREEIEVFSFRGIREKLLQYQKSVIFVIKLAVGFISIKDSVTTYATDTPTNLKYTDILSVMKKLEDTSEINLLARELGITKEGVHRLIWLLGDVQNIKDGSGQYSSETISLVKNALLRERILRQTTIQLNFQPLWINTKLQPTNKHWIANNYGMKIMEGHFVASVTGETV
jgi:hypothetical protein